MRLVQLPPLKHTAIGLLALLFAVGVLAIAWFSFPQPQPDAALLVPTRHTVAFFGNMTADAASTIGESYPLLKTLPLDATPSSVAILSESGATHWAVFRPTVNADIPFDVRTSDERADILLQNITDRLGNDRTFRLLTTQTAGVASWGYVRFPDARLTGAVASLNLQSPASFLVTQDGWRVQIAGHALPPLTTLTQAPLTVFDNPLLIVQSSDLASIIGVGNTLLSESVRTPIESVVRNTLGDLFGTSVSPLYDLLPLLGGTATVQLAPGADASHLNILVDGDLPKDPTVLLSLLDLFKAKLGTVTTDTQTFDEKFTMRSVRQNTDLITDTKERSDSGWQVRTVAQTQTHQTLILAMKGGRYLLGNDTASMMRAMSAPQTPLPVSASMPVMLGLIHADSFSSLLQRTVPTALRSYDIPAGTGGYLQWNVTQDGARTTVLLKKT